MPGASSPAVNRRFSLRPTDELIWDESAVVRSDGMVFHALPIAGESDITLQNARALDTLLRRLGGEPVLVHCSSGNRVGALIALREAALRGAAIDEAIDVGKRWGLTRLEPVVRQRIRELTSPGSDARLTN